ncbi:MAG: hypothetical protein PVI15_09395 [Chromatiales bacterium]|jgi:hypothetical protein
MHATLTVYDETATGKRLGSFELQLVSERISVRDLIRRRIEHEVDVYNREEPGYFKGLVQPTDAEATLNGYKLSKRRRLDAEQQYAQALRAFESNGFFMLVDDRQVEGLDEEITIGEHTEVSFVKLVPLVGG